MLNGGNSSSNPSVISNVLIIIKRDIQISSDEDLLALQVGGTEVANAFLSHGCNTPNGLTRGLEGSELGGNMVGENWVSGGSREAQTAKWGLEEEASSGSTEGGSSVG